VIVYLDIHDETFGGGDKQSQRNRSPGGRLKVNESFFENAPKDGEIQIKFKSPPKGYHYEGEEEEKGSRASPSKVLYFNSVLKKVINAIINKRTLCALSILEVRNPK